MRNPYRIRSIIAAAVATSVVTVGAITTPFAHADNSAAVAQVDALATVMKDVGKAVEPSVVSIEVEKRAPAARVDGGLDEDMLKRFFPDTDGDGEPDVPPGFRFRMPGQDEARFGEGSGVILDATADKAYVLTNNHVAGDATDLTVVLHDGRRIEDVRVIGTDPLSDLAVLEIKAEGLVATRWGDSDSLEKGDIVMAFGAPFGYVGSMTQGIVSAKNRQAGILGRNGYEYFIQTDCAINPGNSGGPLVNVQGEIVGINTAIASRTGGFNGIGFAIPSNLAKFVYDQIKEDGKVTRGYLGVEIRDSSALPKAQVSRLKLGDRQGVFVASAMNDAPADGKLNPNDVIVSIDGKPVKSMTDLRLKVATTTPGTELTFGVIRNGEEKPVTITVGTLPDNRTQTASVGQASPEPAQDEIGATLSDANAARLRSAGLPTSAKGALVTQIKDDSAAQRAGFELGDLVTHINGQPVTNAAEAVAALKDAKLSEGIDLLVTTRAGTKSVFVQSE
jgi:serine protease Do